MIEILIVSGVVLFFGLPFLTVLCACIVGTRADRDAKPPLPKDCERLAPVSEHAAQETTIRFEIY